jgi:hypothetical protein
MTIDKVRKLYKAQPFRPFMIHLADGRKIPVVHPEFMASAPTGRTISVYTPDDDFHIIDLQLVTDLEVKSNGRHQHSKKK